MLAQSSRPASLHFHRPSLCFPLVFTLFSHLLLLLHNAERKKSLSFEENNTVPYSGQSTRQGMRRILFLFNVGHQVVEYLALHRRAGNQVRQHL